MDSGIKLEEYLSGGVEKIVKGILAASLKNPKAALFIANYAVASKKARSKRISAENKGEHIPPFLIASITDKCNLHCKGCYARASHSCRDGCSHSKEASLMSAEDWNSVFSQAVELGIAFILLAGGEPFVRNDVLLKAGKYSDIIFPIFTNGTMIDDTYMRLLDQSRNLMPVISIEGNEQTTDTRRGEGIYKILQNTMCSLKKKGILFGASVTVTKQNIDEVFSDDFVYSLKDAGAKAIVYVEYVPVDESTKVLAPDDETRKKMLSRTSELRRDISEMLFISFPGDEKTSGGCLAAGRGFFHINAYGGAEPCPFSPYSDINVVKTSLKEALHSPLFRNLQSNGSLTDEHIGGCVLYEQREAVKALLKGQN